MTNAQGEGAYPIVAAVYVLVKKDTAARDVRKALGFFQWALTHGGRDASALGFVPLPSSLVTQIKTYWTEQWAWRE